MDGWMDGGMEGWRDGGMEGWISHAPASMRCSCGHLLVLSLPHAAKEENSPEPADGSDEGLPEPSSCTAAVMDDLCSVHFWLQCKHVLALC